MTNICDQVLDVLRSRTGDPTLRWRCAPVVLTGGFWASMWIVELVGDTGVDASLVGPMVLRVMPDPDTGKYETVVQRRAEAAGIPVAAVRASGPRNDQTSEAWMLMDLAAGAPLLAGLSAAIALRHGRRLMRELPDLLARVASRVHAGDIEGWAGELGVSGRDPSVMAFIERIADTATKIGRADLAEHAERLIGEAPPATALCHGDLHPLNVLVDGDRWTLLDWSTAVLADAHYDLGFTSMMLAHPPLGGPKLVRAVARRIGGRLSRRFLERYEHHATTTVDPTRLQWAQQVHALRALVEVAGWQAEGHDRTGHPWLLMQPTLETILEATQ